MTEAAAIREKLDGALDDGSDLRLWLRLLSCTMTIEKTLQRLFAERFSTTLPRFDVLAALDRHPDGLPMSALSKLLLVSNGNTTQLVQKMAVDGLVAVTPSPTDRRVVLAALTPRGREHFGRVARVHREWIEALFREMPFEKRDALYRSLGELKVSIASAGELGGDHDDRR